MKCEYIPQLKQLWQEAFGDTPHFIDSFFATAFAPERCHILEENGQILAAAYWLDCHYDQGKLAYIYAVATARAHRRQGLGHKLMEDIHSLLAQRGYAGSILVPGNPGLAGFYREMGYTFFGGKSEFTCAAGEEALPLRSISAAEYAALRQQYLPDGAVIQERENLEFLQKQVSFSTGNDCLLVYTEENGKLWCPELLGDPACAPRILKSLGAREGRFCGPGQIPFAMFRPLADTKAPLYFGFAFD